MRENSEHKTKISTVNLKNQSIFLGYFIKSQNPFVSVSATGKQSLFDAVNSIPKSAKYTIVQALMIMKNFGNKFLHLYGRLQYSMIKLCYHNTYKVIISCYLFVSLGHEGFTVHCYFRDWLQKMKIHIGNLYSTIVNTTL